VILDVFGQKPRSITLQTFPKHIPPKTASRESQDRAMIDEVSRGFGLCPSV